jgi:Rrf2 family iron-sulfur cluster assembly transcriptional regulator
MCLTHDLWMGLSEHIQIYLANITLADLLAKRDERRNAEQMGESVVKIKRTRRKT